MREERQVFKKFLPGRWRVEAGIGEWGATHIGWFSRKRSLHK